MSSNKVDKKKWVKVDENSTLKRVVCPLLCIHLLRCIIVDQQARLAMEGKKLLARLKRNWSEIGIALILVSPWMLQSLNHQL